MNDNDNPALPRRLSPDGDEGGKLSFWVLTKQAFSWFDPTSEPKYYIRWGGVRMLILIFCFMGASAARGMIQEGKDFDMPYPPEKTLRVEEGWLTEGKGKTTHLLFKSENGTVQRLHPSRVFDFLKTEWF